jgi:hypothetical protein
VVEELAAEQAAQAAVVEKQLVDLSKKAEENQASTSKGLAIVGAVAFLSLALQVILFAQELDEKAEQFLPTAYPWLKENLGDRMKKAGACMKQQLCNKKEPENETKKAQEMTPADFGKVKEHAQEIVLLLGGREAPGLEHFTTTNPAFPTFPRPAELAAQPSEHDHGQPPSSI